MKSVIAENLVKTYGKGENKVRALMISRSMLKRGLSLGFSARTALARPQLSEFLRHYSSQILDMHLSVASMSSKIRSEFARSLVSLASMQQ